VLVAVEPGAPELLQTLLQGLVDAFPGEYNWTTANSTDPAGTVVAGFNPDRPLGYWVYAAVAPFSTLTDGVTLAELMGASGPLAGRPFLVSSEVAAVLQAVWGALPPGAQVTEELTLIDDAWALRPAFSIVPFEALEPRWKALRVDGLSPLDRPLDLTTYPLAFAVGLRGPIDSVERIWSALEVLNTVVLPITNRDESRMTVVAMTGVTALTRATAYQMEIQGLTYPGEEVAAVLQSADLAHISNEVSFSANCPYPNPSRQESNLLFCSDDRYLALLDYIGVDVVELTGNHVNDWGTIPFSRTLGFYRERGWNTFGGGANALEASLPFTVTHNGNRIGFVGCNPVGPQNAWATNDLPGAAYCTIESLTEAVAALAQQVDVVVVGLQYWEYYSYTATPLQVRDFAKVADAGAHIVSGSQGHHAQGFAFPAGRFVHYGLGNLFFDQMDQLGTRQTFVDRHVIYAGRHISTELWTGLMENYARPRLMDESERVDLLQTVFSASGW
jgi:poly-gamma-glutamate synthesis protein (capsule biosynthesis protein)